MTSFGFAELCVEVILTVTVTVETHFDSGSSLTMASHPLSGYFYASHDFDHCFCSYSCFGCECDVQILKTFCLQQNENLSQ